MSDLNFISKTRLPGFIDQLGPDLKAEQALVKIVTNTFESFGYIPLETPPIESMKVIANKGGEETQKLLYKGEGGEWAIRFDLTVPLASFVAYNAANLPDPFKRWQYGFVARGERAQVKKGRLRGFKQLDLDCVSTQTSVQDDIDVIAGMVDTMSQFKTINSQVHVNDRRLLDGLCEVLEITPSSPQAISLISLIDKYDKVGLESTLAEAEKLFGSKTQSLLEKYLMISGTYGEVIRSLKDLLGSSASAQAGLSSLQEIGQVLTDAGYLDCQPQGWCLDPKIARGLDYYTGTVFETFVAGYEDRGSVFSGGRYDNLVEKLGGPKRFAVGASVGVSRLLSILTESGEFKNLEFGVVVTILSFPNQTQGELLALARTLRQAGIITEISNQADKPLGKQLKAAISRHSQYVLLYGDEEKSRGEVRLKKLETETQVNIKTDELVEYLQNNS